MSRFLFGSILIGFLGIFPAQAQEVDSLGKYEPLGLHLGVSLNNALRTVLRTSDTNYGFQAGAVLGRYLAVVEYGWVELSRTSVSDAVNIADNPFEYTSQGSFFRIGPDVNLLINQKRSNFRADGDIIFFGLRFARAQLSDALNFETQDAVTDPDGNNNAFWPAQEITIQNSDKVATWFEMTAGMKVQLYRNIFLGYNLRFKFARNLLNDPALIPYEIPGYGFGSRDEQFRFDYYLFYRIPFKK
ncbi:MAG: DUF6048 family protein [Bacteroidota bacterium]